MLFGITLKAVKSTKVAKAFCRGVVRRNKVILSEKSIKGTQVITSVLEEIRSDDLRLLFTKNEC